jgi:hypothetical protein
MENQTPLGSHCKKNNALVPSTGARRVLIANANNNIQHSLIDANSRNYQLPPAAAELFQSITELQPDLFDFLADFTNLSDKARKVLVIAEDRGIPFSEYQTWLENLSLSPLDKMLKAYLERSQFKLPRLKVDIKRCLEQTKEKTP